MSEVGVRRDKAALSSGCKPLKNRDPDRWRDVQNVEHVLGKYIISDKPMSEEEWARERATVIEEKVVEEPTSPKVLLDRASKT
jgi:hypothetical protein